MGMTKEMSKHQKKAARQEERSKVQARQQAMQVLTEQDKVILDMTAAAKAEEEAAVNAEIERQFQEYLVHGEPKFIASRSKRELALLEAKAKFLAAKKETVPKILANTGAKKVINEESLHLTEKYSIQRSDLGKGTYGLVYRAEGPNKKAIVCKVTSLSPLPAQYRFRLQAGFNTLRFLKEHPHMNIVTIIDIFESPDKSYVFMEFFETDLFKRIKKEAPFKQSVGLGIGKQVAAGLTYLHSIGVAHCNLKPHHVLFDLRGNRAVLTGFGWSVVAYDPDRDQAILQKGSKKQKFHHDFAPELMLDDLYDPLAADVWSFGALLVNILTKEHPYEPASTHRIDIQWKLAFKKAGVRLSDKVHDILDKCFGAEPPTRGSMIEILSEFEKPE